MRRLPRLRRLRVRREETSAPSHCRTISQRRSRRPDSNRGPLHYETTTTEDRRPRMGTCEHELPGERPIRCSNLKTRKPPRCRPPVPDLYPAGVRTRARHRVPAGALCELERELAANGPTDSPFHKNYCSQRRKPITPSMRRIPLAFVLLSLTLVACGAPNRHAANGSNLMTKTDYVRRVNSICEHYNALQRSIGAPTGSLQQQAAIAHELNVLSLQKIADARRVPAPAADRGLTKAILDRFEQAVAFADRSTQLVSTDTTAANAARDSGIRMMEIAVSELNGYGLTTCSQ